MNDVSVLDNKYLYPITHEGIAYPALENAFQATRFKDPAMKKRFVVFTPHEAAYKGKSFVTTETNWVNNKYDIMYQLLVEKFKNPEFRKTLLATGDSKIVMFNNQHDNEWGSCTCSRCKNRGYNKAGILLMQIRDELKD